MKFDLSTFIFQVLNFAVLLLILYRVVFRPVREIMEKRRAQVAASLDAADQARREAEALTAHLAQEKERVDRLRVEHIERMKGEVDELRRQQLERAGKDVQAALEKGRAVLDAERRKFEADLAEQARRTVIAFAGRLLQDLADETLHKSILRKFPQALAESVAGRAAGPASGGPLAMHLDAAYPLAAEETEELRSRLEERFAGTVVLTTSTEPGLLAGVRLAVADRVYDLSLRGQLEDFSARLKERR